MAGYPNFISRDSLGPTYVNAGKIGKVDEEADAGIFNLLCWQTAGMNGVVPRGIVIGQDDGSGNLSVLRQAYAWDVNNALAPMVFTPGGAGSWSWVLPGTGAYPDMNGVSTAANLLAAEAVPQGTSARIMIAEVNVDGKSGTMRCYVSNTAVLTNIGSVGVPKRFILKLY